MKTKTSCPTSRQKLIYHFSAFNSYDCQDADNIATVDRQ